MAVPTYPNDALTNTTSALVPPIQLFHAAILNCSAGPPPHFHASIHDKVQCECTDCATRRAGSILVHINTPGSTYPTLLYQGSFNGSSKSSNIVVYGMEMVNHDPIATFNQCMKLVGLVRRISFQTVQLYQQAIAA